jgi:uncharacterized protein YjbJ (UPF0337 family)
VGSDPYAEHGILRSRVARPVSTVTTLAQPTHASTVSSLIPYTANDDTLKGPWNPLTDKVKARWGTLTDDSLTDMTGKKDQLVGKIQEPYEVCGEETER